MASAKMASAIDVRIDDVGSILKFRIGFPSRENSAGFCQSVWLQGSILNFRIGSVSPIGGLIPTTLFADTVSGSEREHDCNMGFGKRSGGWFHRNVSFFSLHGFTTAMGD